MVVPSKFDQDQTSILPVFPTFTHHNTQSDLKKICVARNFNLKVASQPSLRISCRAKSTVIRFLASAWSHSSSTTSWLWQFGAENAAGHQFHWLLGDGNGQHAILEATGSWLNLTQKNDLWHSHQECTISKFSMDCLTQKRHGFLMCSDINWALEGLLKKISAKLGAMMHRMPWSFKAQGLGVVMMFCLKTNHWLGPRRMLSRGSAAKIVSSNQNWCCSIRLLKCVFFGCYDCYAAKKVTK